MLIFSNAWASLKTKIMTAVVLGAVCALIALAPVGVLFVSIVLTGIYVIVCEWRPLARRAKTPPQLMHVVLYAWYIIGYFSTFAQGRIILGLAILLVALHDSVAQITGLLFGRHPLAPTISPRKTIEGAIGGWLATVIAVVTYFIYTHPKPNVVFPIIYATGFSLCAISGDLFVSYLKRRAGVKDTGVILPGHGGVLDRIDSLLAVICYVFVLYLFISVP